MSHSLLLLPLLACLFAVSSLAHESTSGLHPVVLVPAYSCGNLDARLTDKYRPPAAFPWCAARKGKGWFRLWENHTAVELDPKQVPCYAGQLRLVYDHVAGDYRNAPGVQTRVVAFGSVRGFGSDDPAKKNMCMEKLVKTLDGVGYRDGESLFGAPYDLRYAAAAAPGQASRAFSKFTSSLARLVEHASSRNGGKPVILVSHSLGGLNVNEFLNQRPLPWRKKFVNHFVMLSTGVGGGTVVLQFLASAIGSLPPPSDVLSFTNTSRSFASTLGALPSPKAYGHTPLVVTRAKNFSAYDMPEFLAAVGFSGRDVLARYVMRALPVTLNFKAPLVPMTSVTGVGVPTASKLVFWDGDFGAQPQVVYGDGDGTVNVENVLALGTVVGKDPEQPFFRSVIVPNTTHMGIISDDWALKHVVSEILEASRATHHYSNI
ncbi:hypothetical protein BS78_01G262500 [Paspalum vaginatum]|nr:hypothetical protein BS78_01G262500 [Paspalum vaginatum]KAJ1295962.1 hypothetical protein BS78_01G262500 [Paspalum vaginatum]KAJ1295963.1 hypothetical protein BS78_01G262500 [Paspalum vaginatum]KAJ1295964.1 hypothetical protein BS78_01G262500 [Paspalum vaginatum]